MSTAQSGSTRTDTFWLHLSASGDNEDVLLNFTHVSHSRCYEETDGVRDGHDGEREDTTGSIPSADVTECVLFCDPVSTVRLQVELTSSLLTPAVEKHYFYIFQVRRTQLQPSGTHCTICSVTSCASLNFASIHRYLTVPPSWSDPELESRCALIPLQSGSHDLVCDVANAKTLNLSTNKP